MLFCNRRDFDIESDMMGSSSLCLAVVGSFEVELVRRGHSRRQSPRRAGDGGAAVVVDEQLLYEGADQLVLVGELDVMLLSEVTYTRVFSPLVLLDDVVDDDDDDANDA